MTETEEKALALLDAVAKERGDADGWGFVNREDIRSEALCRAIEQHEAYKRDVSNAVEAAKRVYGGHRGAFDQLDRFILPIIRRRELEAGEKVKAECARENLMICLTNGEKLTDEAMEMLNFAADRIRALDVAAIIGDSHV